MVVDVQWDQSLNPVFAVGSTKLFSGDLIRFVISVFAPWYTYLQGIRTADPVWPHRWQPTRLPRPWDSPGNNTGVGCHFLLQCMKVKSESEVAQLCLNLSDRMDCSLPGSSIHGIFQARVLEWGAIAFSEKKWASQMPIKQGRFGLDIYV